MEPPLKAVDGRARPGPKPRFSKGALVDAALRLVDSHGFDSLSLRSVARALGVTPMALYTYVQSSEELAALVIDRLVELKSAHLSIPEDWRPALHTFAAALDELLGEHPALLQAYASGAVRTPAALRTAEAVLGSLRRAGLSPAAAANAYAAVHAVVLGRALQNQAPPAPRVPAGELPTLHAQQVSGYPPGRTSLQAAVELLIRGVEAELRT